MIKRLESFIKSKQLTKSSFATKIGVQRSSLAHFFSGRNKPSLDFYIKIKNKYPEVDLNWIISGVNSKNVTKKISDNNEIESIIILFKDGTFKTH